MRLARISVGINFRVRRSPLVKALRDLITAGEGTLVRFGTRVPKATLLLALLVERWVVIDC